MKLCFFFAKGKANIIIIVFSISISCLNVVDGQDQASQSLNHLQKNLTSRFFFFLRAKLPIQITLTVWRYVFHDGWVSFGLSFDDQNIWDYNKDGEHWQIKNEPAGLVNLPWPMVSSCTTWSSLASISASSSRYSESIFTLIVAPPPSLPAAPGLPSVALWDEDLIVRSSAWTPFVVAGADGGGGGGGAGLWNVDHFLFHH